MEREKEIMKDVPGWEVSVWVLRCAEDCIDRGCDFGTLLLLCVFCHAGGKECVQQPQVPARAEHCVVVMRERSVLSIIMDVVPVSVLSQCLDVLSEEKPRIRRVMGTLFWVRVSLF